VSCGWPEDTADGCANAVVGDRMTNIVNRAQVADFAFILGVGGLGAWVALSTDPAVRAKAKAYVAALAPLTAKQEAAVENGVRNAHVITLHGAHHYVYLSKEDAVVRYIDAFVSTLK
jgi:hypothetical protein